MIYPKLPHRITSNHAVWIQVEREVEIGGWSGFGRCDRVVT